MWGNFLDKQHCFYNYPGMALPKSDENNNNNNNIPNRY